MVRYQRIRYIPTVEDYHNSMVHQIPLNQNGPTLPPGEQPLPAPPPPEDHIGAMPGSVVINADGVVLQMGPPVPRSARIPGGAPGEAPPAGNPPAATEPAPGSDLAPEEGAGLAPEFLPGGAVNAPATNPGGPSATNPGDFPAANPGPSPDPGAPGPSRLRTRRPTPSPEPSDYDEDEEDDPEQTQLEQLEQRNRELEAAVAQRDAALASAQRRLGSLEGHVAATQNTVAALRREIGGPSRPGPSAPAPTDHSGQGSEPTTNCLWCGLDGHWVPDCPKKAAGLTPEQAQLQLGTRTLVRKLKEAIAAKKAAKRPASGSGKKGGGSSRDGGGSGKRGRPGPGSGPGPVPPAAVPAIKQPMVTPPPAFLICAMKAAVPMATAKVAARWLRKGGRAVVAVISPDGSATPKPEVTPHGLPDAIKAQLDALLAEYSDVFTPLTGLPPDRPVGHTIPLEPGNRPPATPMYRLSKPEHDELKQQIQDLLSKGMIEPSSSPYAAPVLFVQKKSGELRMCIDYRQLNKITLRDQYPLPRIDDLFDKLSGCKVFSSLDLQAGYHQIRITPEDVPKTAFRTPEGHFQFKVLCFGLTNAPATFQRVMNDAFATVLGKCALVYLDDILVMSKSVQDHLLHLKQVFELLRKNKLYAKLSKSAIAAVPMLRLPDHTKPFQVYCDASLQGLGAVLMQDGYPLAYLSRKLSPAEINYTTGEQEFLSLVTACKEWRCYLEGVPFTLFTDHQPLVALPTQKVLSRRQARWMEFMSRFSYSLVHIAGTVNPADPLSRIVHDAPESVSVCAVTTRRQAKLSLEGGGARDAGLRAAAPAAISAKSPLALSQFEKDTTCVEAMLDPIGSETPVTQIETAQYPAAPAAPMGLSDQLTLGYQQDPAFTAGADHSGMYQDTDGLWRISGKDLVVVPNVPELREHILHEMHDAAYAGHVGMTKTLERVTRVFWWNTVRANVRDYVGTCDACQRDKSSNSKPGGLLRPLTVPGYRWEHVSMDLVTKLPTGTHGYDAICVIVDRLSKMVHFVPCKESMNAMAFTRLFINNVFRLHGLPAEVLTDRGAHFNNKFWHAVKKLLGMKTNMSTAYRPQSDGQTERYNRVLEEMLRHYISPTQADWPDHLALAEFAVNNSWQESIHSTPFFLNTGQSPVTPGLRDLPDGGRCPSAHAFATWWKEGVAHARRHMADAQARYKRHADTGLKDVEFEVGAQVLLSTRNLRIKTGKVRKFVPRYVGPFVVEAKINANAYRLTLPANMSRLHPVFHVSLLKKYSGSDVGIMPPPVEWMDETPVYYVERLLDHRYVRAGKAGEFLVQWEGYDASFNTWEPRANLTGCDKLLAEYNAIHSWFSTLHSGSGQQDQGQGRAVKVVIAERRQVIKACLRGLVEAALPDLGPAQVDAIVAEINKRMTMGSKQCVLAAVLCLSVLLQSFLVQLGIWDPQLLAQIRDAMELLTKASVIQHMMRGPHHHGIRLLPGEVAAFEQPSSAWPVAMLQQLDEERLTGDGNSLNANATNIITSIQEFYRHPGRFIRWWCKAVGVVEEGFSRAMKKHFPQLVLGRLDYSLPDRHHKWRLPPNSVLRQPRWREEVVKHRRLLGLPATWREGQDSIGKGGAGRLPIEKRVRYVLFVNRSLEGWQAAHDTNGCLNLQRIGESRQRPIELCRWDDLEALPPIGEEYQQRYKLVNDRLPKGRHWLHRAAEYRRGIDGPEGRSAAGPASRPGPGPAESDPTLHQLAACLVQLRSLRESLVSNQEGDSVLACHVAELSADVAAACGRGAASELLKALHGLVTSPAYALHQATPAAEQGPLPASRLAASHSRGSEEGLGQMQGQVQEQSPSEAHREVQSCSSPKPACRPCSAPGPSHYHPPTLTQQQQEQQPAWPRAGEMAAAHLLFFLCVPACPSGCECTSLLAGCGLLAKQWRSPHVQFAVQVASALAARDWAAFLQLRMRIPPSLASPRTRQAASAASYSLLPPASPAAHDSGSGSQVAAWPGSLAAVSGSARAREGSRCHQQGSRLLMEILDTRLPAVQHAAVRALAAAYRSLPISAALVLTGLVQGACTTAQGEGDMRGKD
ncbi:hypothetical protein QJQ45_002627 [Haematococcus lacustris]|nr:hypothetical protein QJQ45_002627 [Haematococcus lacustris]